MSEQAWAAGFFDGEGTVTRSGGWMIAIKQAIDSDLAPAAPEVLRRFQAAVHGAGRIGGPYTDKPERLGYSSRRTAQFMWYARNGDAADVMAVLLPYLSAVKRHAAGGAVGKRRVGHLPPGRGTPEGHL